MFKRFEEPTNTELSFPEKKVEVPCVKDVVSKREEESATEIESMVDNVYQSVEPQGPANLFPIKIFHDELLEKMT